jgi:hypothetical protein
MAGTPTRHAQLSNEQILLALFESYNIIAAITKYQVFLTSGIGLPKYDIARLCGADSRALLVRGNRGGPRPESLTAASRCLLPPVRTKQLFS